MDKMERRLPKKLFIVDSGFAPWHTPPDLPHNPHLGTAQHWPHREKFSVAPGSNVSNNLKKNISLIRQTGTN